MRSASAGAINLAQGFPEQDPPAVVMDAHQQAIREGRNQYTDMRGLPAFREAISVRRALSLDPHVYNPDTEITVTCGATEAMAAALLAIVQPGDEVLVQEPTYENYPPQIILAGARPSMFRLAGTSSALDPELIEAACGPKTKAIILNTPNNPTGRVFDRSELASLATLCLERDIYLIVDEVYEALVWDGRVHVSPAELDGMRERTVVIGSLSKTYAATGWRVGWALAPESLTAAIRRAHDFLTGVVSTPAQYAGVVALKLPETFYLEQRAEYEKRRRILEGCLLEAGLTFSVPQGTYYFFVDVRSMGYSDSASFSEDLLRAAKVGVVPWQAFFREPHEGDRCWARINFAKSSAVLKEAGERILEFADHRRT